MRYFLGVSARNRLSLMRRYVKRFCFLSQTKCLKTGPVLHVPFLWLPIDYLQPSIIMQPSFKIRWLSLEHSVNFQWNFISLYSMPTVKVSVCQNNSFIILENKNHWAQEVETTLQYFYIAYKYIGTKCQSWFIRNKKYLVNPLNTWRTKFFKRLDTVNTFLFTFDFDLYDGCI